MEIIKCPHCDKLSTCEFIGIVYSDMLFMGGEIIEKYKCGDCNEYFYVEKELEVTRVEIRKVK